MQSEADDTKKIDPQRIGDYTILHCIGIGGHGQVYKAINRHTRQEVALKVLNDIPNKDDLATKNSLDLDTGKRHEIENKKQSLEDFLREMEILGRLDHRNIANIKHGGEHEGKPYYVMDFIEGENLTEYMDKLSPMRVVNIGIELADALEHAHSMGLVHLDLKPANIMLDKYSRAIMIDFGIAKHMEWVYEGDVKVEGTFPYLAPEQFRPRYQPDPRTDLYKLVKVMYALLR